MGKLFIDSMAGKSIPQKTHSFLHLPIFPTLPDPSFFRIAQVFGDQHATQCKVLSRTK